MILLILLEQSMGYKYKGEICCTIDLEKQSFFKSTFGLSRMCLDTWFGWIKSCGNFPAITLLFHILRLLMLEEMSIQYGYSIPTFIEYMKHQHNILSHSCA